MVNINNGLDTLKLDFKKLELVEYMSRGSSGKVYKSKYDGDSVISKCFNIDNYHCVAGQVRDVTDELTIYRYLSNSIYCCELVGWCYSEEDIYIIMKDYNVKGDLYDYLNEDDHWFKFNREINNNQFFYQYKHNKWIFDLDRKTKVTITTGILRAINELHAKNIVHCDLKTNNILFNEDTKKVILIDFGASHYLGDKKDGETYENMGTLGYACPKLTKGFCSKKSDIYSLAVCIIEVWSGAIWNEGNSFTECRLEMLSSLRRLALKEPGLAKELRKGVSLNIDKRPYIQTLAANIENLIDK